MFLITLLAMFSLNLSAQYLPGRKGQEVKPSTLKWGTSPVLRQDIIPPALMIFAGGVMLGGSMHLNDSNHQNSLAIAGGLTTTTGVVFTLGMKPMNKQQKWTSAGVCVGSFAFGVGFGYLLGEIVK